MSTTSPLIQDEIEDNETFVEEQQEATDNLYNAEIENIDEGGGVVGGTTPGVIGETGGTTAGAIGETGGTGVTGGTSG